MIWLIWIVAMVAVPLLTGLFVWLQLQHEAGEATMPSERDERAAAHAVES